MISWDQIDLKGRKSGQYKTTCPSCSEERKKKKDPCLSVNIDQGKARCWHCDEISIRDFKERHEKTYSIPEQDWQNHTNLSDKVVNWFKSRGISQRTIIECKITEEEYFQPSAKKKMKNIVFNYFESNSIVNKKYRSGAKHFTQSKNAKKIFYGINDVVGDTECYIVEGEMDKLSFWEIGVKNCISVPNGANDDSDYFENCEEYLSGIEVFFIAVDMDTQGQKLERALIKRLGKHKCRRVKFKGKDANDDLMSSPLELEESIKKKYHYPIDGTFTAKDIEKEIFKLYSNGYEKTIRPSIGFKNFNRSFGIIPGQLITVTGIPGHGKSSFIEWYCLCLVRDLKFRISFYSPEHFPMQLHQSVLAEKVIGKQFLEIDKNKPRMSERELSDYINWSKDKIYLTIPEKAAIPNWDWLFLKFEEQIYRYNIDIFVIDAFNKVKLMTGTLLEMSDVLARLTLFCQMHGVNVFLIAHPTKMRKDETTGLYSPPTLYDVKGTGDFYDQTHCGLTVYRYFKEDDPYIKVIVNKIKYRHQGILNEQIPFKFSTTSGRFFEYNDLENNTSFLYSDENIFNQTKAPF